MPKSASKNTVHPPKLETIYYSPKMGEALQTQVSETKHGIVTGRGLAMNIRRNSRREQELRFK